MDEYTNLIKINRITVNVCLEKDEEIAATEILPLQNSEGQYDELALDYYHEFIDNAVAIFDWHDFEIIEEHQSPTSHSVYLTFVKREDYYNYDYKYVLFVRLSDHDNRKTTERSKKAYYNRQAELLKQPEAKSKQRWKLKEITVNKDRYFSYEDALRDIENRLAGL